METHESRRNKIARALMVLILLKVMQARSAALSRRWFKFSNEISDFSRFRMIDFDKLQLSKTHRESTNVIFIKNNFFSVFGANVVGGATKFLSQGAYFRALFLREHVRELL